MQDFFIGLFIFTSLDKFIFLTDSNCLFIYIYYIVSLLVDIVDFYGHYLTLSSPAFDFFLIIHVSIN